jgi:RNA polymerase sigma-70 factor (ECF subfamily)
VNRQQDTDPGSDDLVLRASRGDAASIDQLLLRYLPRLRAFVRARVDGELRARESSSDLVQSVCREVLDHAGTFTYEGEERFRAWLFTTALNKIRQRARHYATQKRAAPAAQQRISDAEVADVYASVHSPSQVAAAGELQELMEQALEQLSEDHREVITLSRIVGLSHAEIAHQMQRSDGAVRVLLSRALLALVEAIDRLQGKR